MQATKMFFLKLTVRALIFVVACPIWLICAVIQATSNEQVTA
jgi:hypothetical protein